MALRPDIIMAGRQPNMVNVLANSAQAAGMQNEVVKQNRLAQLYNEQGPAIMSGDKNALNAYAKISPEAALGVQGTRLGMDVQQAQLEQLRFQTKTAMEDLIRTRGQEEAAQIAAQEQRAVKAALAAPSQEALDAFLTQNGMEDFVGVITIENRDMYASQYIEGMSDAFEQFGPKPPEDRKYAEDAQGLKRYVDTGELVFPNDVPKPMQRPTQKAADGYLYYTDGKKERVFPDVQAKEDAPLVDMRTIVGGESTSGMTADQGGTKFPINEAELGEARSAFGATGLGARAVNAITDFVSGTEAFPVQGENLRFFKNLEEDFLTVIAQAYSRQPAQDLMNNLRSLLPNAGTTEGAQSAFRELMLMGRRFERDRDAAVKSLQYAGTPAQQSEIINRIIALESAIQLAQEGIVRLSPSGSDSAGQGGLDPTVEERLRAYEQ